MDIWVSPVRSVIFIFVGWIYIDAFIFRRAIFTPCERILERLFFFSVYVDAFQGLYSIIAGIVEIHESIFAMPDFVAQANSYAQKAISLKLIIKFHYIAAGQWYLSPCI